MAVRRRSGELVQHPQVAPDQVEVVQRVAYVVVDPAPRLEVEDAERRHPRFVGRVVEQPLHLVERQVSVRLRDVEQDLHPEPQRRLVRSQPGAHLRQLGRLGRGLERAHERSRRHLGHGRQPIRLRLRRRRPPRLSG
jgi:hypothetical protein